MGDEEDQDFSVLPTYTGGFTLKVSVVSARSPALSPDEFRDCPTALLGDRARCTTILRREIAAETEQLTGSRWCSQPLVAADTADSAGGSGSGNLLDPLLEKLSGYSFVYSYTKGKQ